MNLYKVAIGINYDREVYVIESNINRALDRVISIEKQATSTNVVKVELISSEIILPNFELLHKENENV